MQKLGFATGGGEKADYADAKTKVLSSLKDFFKPEFLNRLDDVIVFDILPPDAIAKIVEIQVEEVKKRLTAKEISAEISPDAYAYLAKEGYSPQYGARPLKRLIQNKILNPLASLLISQGLAEGGAVSIGMKNGEVSFEVKNTGGKIKSGRAVKSKEVEQITA